VLPGSFRFFGSSCFFLIIVLLLAPGSGCSNYTGADWASVPGVQQSLKVIVDYDLKNYVPVPTIGGAPAGSLTRGDMTITVVWKILGPNNEETPVAEPFTAFKQGKVYRAYITLEARNDYRFDQGTNFLYSPDGSVAVQPNVNPDPYSRVLTPVTYKPTETAIEIIDLDLTSHIPVPETGKAPARLVNGGEYSGMVAWDPSDNVFDGSTAEYKAMAILHSNSGYVFGENEFTHFAPNATVGPVNITDDNATILITFSMPAAGP
jgi:hypothetical protein